MQATLPNFGPTESRAFIADQAQKMCNAIAQRLGTTAPAHITTRVAAAGIAAFESAATGHQVYEVIRHDAELLLTKQAQAQHTAGRIIDKIASSMDNDMLLSHQAL